VVSTENGLILAFGTAGLILAYAAAVFTDLPAWVGVAIVIGVGVVIPQLVLAALARTD
jgi:hypothetical protein